MGDFPDSQLVEEVQGVWKVALDEQPPLEGRGEHSGFREWMFWLDEGELLHLV